MFLLTAYRDKIIPAMEDEHVRLSEGGGHKVVVVCQEDGAGPHCCKVYKEDMFHQCDWLIFNQPPQSPVTNVKDSCLFLMWSKAVSSDQALSIGINILNGEQIYQKFQKVF